MGNNVTYLRNNEKTVGLKPKPVGRLSLREYEAICVKSEASAGSFSNANESPRNENILLTSRTGGAHQMKIIKETEDQKQEVSISTNRVSSAHISRKADTTDTNNRLIKHAGAKHLTLAVTESDGFANLKRQVNTARNSLQSGH